jgi:hypothetical protein
MKKEILIEVKRIKEVMGLIVEATNPIFSWIDDLFYNLAVKNKTFQDALNEAGDIQTLLKNNDVISPLNTSGRAGKPINAEEIADTIKSNGKFKVKLPDGRIVDRNLSDLVDEETLTAVLKKYSLTNPEQFRTTFRTISGINPSYLPDGVGNTIESLVKNKSTLISKGVEGKQKYKKFLDELDELTTNSNMDAQMKDLVSDFVMSEKNSIGIAPTRDEIVETIRKKFQLKTGKKDLPTEFKFLGMKFKEGITPNQIDDIVNEIQIATEIKDVQQLEELIEKKLKELGFDDGKIQKMSKNLYQQNCFNYYFAGEMKNPGFWARTVDLFKKAENKSQPQPRTESGSSINAPCLAIYILLFGSVFSLFGLTIGDVAYDIAEFLSISDMLGFKSSDKTKKYFQDYCETEFNSCNNLLQDVTVKEVVGGEVQQVIDKAKNKDGKGQEAQTATLKDVNRLAIRKGDDSLVVGYDTELGGEDYSDKTHWFVTINETKVFFPNLPANFWTNLSELNVFANWLSKINPTTKNDFTLATYSIEYKPDTEEYFVWTRNNPNTAVKYKEDNADTTSNTEDDYSNTIISDFNKWIVGPEPEQWGAPINTNIWNIKVEGNIVVVEKIDDESSYFYKYESQGNGSFKLKEEKVPAQ